ncbi:HTH-type transcriptional regulator lrpC [Anaerotruncus sp. 2789STDY5834896]|uniref:HTH-type transcriptional regulator lrpC n=2 Tax=Oscillospiraceae TaxID=216572 RepID=A0A1C6HX03_9FIRM|nr:HTH-type transcriptional regulator lrpC [uncultured Anaerotruncus sp.]
MGMDRVDQKIVALLQRNARMPLKQLAQQVYLSSPAVAARIERLERQGIITGYCATVDAKKAGYAITAFINMVLSHQNQPAFRDFIKEQKNVLECYHVAGAFSMLLKVCFPDTAQLDLFVAQLQRFGNTQTQIVFSQVIAPRQLEFSSEQ